MTTWKDIPGFEGRYQVSDKGGVRSVDRMVRGVSKAGREYRRRVLGTYLRPAKCRGYLIVNLFPTGTIAVHLLVARAFVAGERHDLEVNHIDGNKLNCAAPNLEWITHRYNLEHTVTLGLQSQAVRVVHPMTGEVFPSIARASKLCRLAHRTVSANWSRA